MTADDTTLSDELATACRILAMEGLVEGTLGHISVRTDDNEVLVRSRGPSERGLLFSTVADVHRASLDGSILDGAVGYDVPNEFPLHAETLRRRDDVNVVVHAHPPPIVACSIARIDFAPIFGSYNIPATFLALEGVPVYPKSKLINHTEDARDVAEVLADRSVCVLQGHGMIAVGDNLAQAVLRAINLNALAAITLSVYATGARPPRISDEEVAGLPDLGRNFNDTNVWRYLVEKERRLRAG